MINECSSLQNNEFPEILNAAQITKMLHVSPKQVEEIMQYPSFPVIVIGRIKVVRKRDLLKWVSTHRLTG